MDVPQNQTKMAERFESVSDYEETPVSSRGGKQSESEIQKYRHGKFFSKMLITLALVRYAGWNRW